MELTVKGLRSIQNKVQEWGKQELEFSLGGWKVVVAVRLRVALRWRWGWSLRVEGGRESKGERAINSMT